MDQAPSTRSSRLLLSAALLGLAAIPLLPTPQLDGVPRASALMDLAHLPLAALLCWLLTRLLRHLVPAAALTLAICVAIEGLQALLGTGEASLGDLAVDLAGIAAALALMAALDDPTPRRIVLVVLALVLLSAWPVARTLWVFGEEHARALRLPVLADFEGAGDLLPWQGSGGCALRLATEHPHSGSYSLKCRFSPGTRPAVVFSDPPHDWSAYHRLDLQVFVAGEDPLPFFVKITDELAYRDPKERFLKRVDLAPGPNTLHIELENLVVGGQHRKIDTSRIKTVVFLLKELTQERVLFLDDLRLQPK